MYQARIRQQVRDERRLVDITVPRFAKEPKITLANAGDELFHGLGADRESSSTQCQDIFAVYNGKRVLVGRTLASGLAALDVCRFSVPRAYSTPSSGTRDRNCTDAIVLVWRAVTIHACATLAWRNADSLCRPTIAGASRTKASLVNASTMNNAKSMRRVMLLCKTASPTWRLQTGNP